MTPRASAKIIAGALWVGTLRNGVTRISDGQVTSWSTRNGLAANRVKAFYSDLPQELCGLAPRRTAASVRVSRTGGFDSISVRQGLYNDNVFSTWRSDDDNLDELQTPGGLAQPA